MANKICILLFAAAVCTSCVGAPGITGTPTRLPASTLTLSPTASTTASPAPETEPPTPTLHPALVAVLTSTPNFRNIATRTPAEPQKCPEAHSDLTPDFPKDVLEPPRDFSYPQAILDFLNAGGTVKSLIKYLDLPARYLTEEDLTGDGVPELVAVTRGLDVFTCNAGQYLHALHVYAESAPSILAIQDMNLNRIPELVLEDEVFSAESRSYQIYEWNGSEFQSLIWGSEDLLAWSSTREGRSFSWYNDSIYPEPRIQGIASEATIRDLDGNGTQELIVRNQVLSVRLRGYSPWRATIETYKWNGVIFLWDRTEIEPPVYRFQAVQDADRLALLGEYEKALDLYQAVISDTRLSAWAPENYQEQIETEGQRTPTPTPIPLIQEEYDHLAAYAYYRILLLHVIQGDLASAQHVYETLQEKFPKGEAGYLYVEMAKAFWEEYRSSGSTREACAPAIRYAEDHQSDIFAHLGNSGLDYYSHGVQSHYYLPWDLCPFQ